MSETPLPQEFDVLVIGGGPGGYSCAIRAAQNGLVVGVIERWTKAETVSFGGTCLQVGCIPSKSLLEASLRFYELSTGHIPGLSALQSAGIKPSLPELMQFKDEVVGKLTSGVAQLLKGNNVVCLHGVGELLGTGQVQFTPYGGDAGTSVNLKAKHCVLAQGSEVMQIPSLPIDHEYILDSTDAIALDSIPASLGVVGAGAIGLELGSVWARLGSEVTVLEALDTFIPFIDADMARLANRSLKSQGLDIQLGTKIENCRVDGGKVVLVTEAGEMVFDKVIVAAGRRPQKTNSQCTELLLDERGFVKVDEHCQTSVAQVFAIGDLVRGPMLAHKAIHEGVMVADRLVGEAAQVDLDLIPAVIYTHPEVAWVGLNSTTAQEQGVAVDAGRFSFASNGRALAASEGEGAAKVLTDKSSGRIVGVQVVGPNAAELVQQGLIAMEFGGTADDVAEICFAHPTTSETFHEAALSAIGRPLHGIPPKKRT